VMVMLEAEMGIDITKYDLAVKDMDKEFLG
jgi:hypothetical protein